MEFCNICGSSSFLDMGLRVRVKCNSCFSLERHRLFRWVLERYVTTNEELIENSIRVFHLAPEEMTHRYLNKIFGSGYICSDLFPQNYPHAQCLKIYLPDGLSIFPNNYFDLILHNHVLEHIPGDYKDHIIELLRILRSGGQMLFTIPSIKAHKSVQGGELLASDFDRKKLHGQHDHYKTFGFDFIEFLSSLSSIEFTQLYIPPNFRTKIRAPHDSIFCVLKL